MICHQTQAEHWTDREIVYRASDSPDPITRELARRLDRLKGLPDDMGDKEVEIEDLEAENLDLVNEVRELRAEIDKLEQENRKLKDKIDRLKAVEKEAM